MAVRLALLALALLLLTAAPARADITITNVQAKPANTKAGGNSDFTLSFDLGGSESIRDLVVHMPPGLLGNPNSVARCAQAQFMSDSCPAASKVGTETVEVTVGGTFPSSASGEVFNLVPDKPEPAQLGIRLDTPTGSQRMKSDVTVRPSDFGLTSTTRNIPNVFAGFQVRIDRVSLTLLAKSGAGKPFTTNPTSCNPAVTKLHAVGHGNSAGDGQGSFTPTACEQLAFAPKLTATVGTTGRTGALSMPPLTTVIEQKPGEAANKSAKATLLTPLGPNVNALSNACPADAYQSDSCPSQSRVGNATVISPVLTKPLAGPVRLVENPNGLPKLVIYLSGDLKMRLVGDIDLSTAGAATTFPALPDAPLSRVKFDFTGGPNGLVNTTEDLCRTGASLKGDFTGHNGKSVTSTIPAAVKGCAGRGGKRPTGSVVLRRLATKSPLLRASAKRGKRAKKLRTLSIKLPGPLSFDRGYLSPGVRASKGLRRSLSGKRTLTLRTKSAAGAASIAATVSKRALKVSSGLRRRVRKHPRVNVVLRMTEVGGRVTTLRKRVRVR